ncbi:MAG: tetratricopeptide repeat protein [Planctomycetes bacterium]|nr:tetratricopeptide repeat protein [Planctomycetota bacterium]
MSRSYRRNWIAKGSVAAAMLAGAPACDRSSSSPSNDNSASPVEAERAPAPDHADSNVNSAPEPLPRTMEPVAPAAVESSNSAGNRGSTGESERAVTNSDGFVPPEVDVSGLSEFEREAIQKLRSGVIDVPGSVDRVAELGMWYCVRGYPKAAATCFTRACELLPKAMKYRYLLAIAYEESEQWDEAIDVYRQCVGMDGTYVAAYCNLGRLLLEKGDPEARAMFEKTRELDPSDSIAEWGLGRLDELQGDIAAATAHYEKAIELQPSYKDAHFALSKILREAGKTAEADAHFQQYKDGRKGLVRNDPIRFELTTRIRGEKEIAEEALNAARQGKPNQAAKFLIKTMRKGMAGAPIRTALGEIFLLENRYDDALLSFVEAEKLDPDSKVIKAYIAMTLIEVGEVDSAIERLSVLQKGDSKNAVVVNRLGYALLKKGELRRAEELLRNAIELSPGKAGFHINLAECLAALKKQDEALAETDRAIRLDKQNVSPWMFKGSLLSAAGRLEEAEAALNQAMAVAPKAEAVYTTIAGDCPRAGRFCRVGALS